MVDEPLDDDPDEDEDDDESPEELEELEELDPESLDTDFLPDSRLSVR